MVWARNLLFLGRRRRRRRRPRRRIFCRRASPPRSASTTPPRTASPSSATVVERVDAAFRQQWLSKGSSRPARPPDLLQARRLALALMGTVPSLEEIRQFEALPARPADAVVDRPRPRRTAASPTTSPSASPGPTSAPRTARSSSSAAAGSSPGSASRSPPTGPTTRSSATLIAGRGPLDRPAGHQLRHRHRPERQARTSPTRCGSPAG